MSSIESIPCSICWDEIIPTHVNALQFSQAPTTDIVTLGTRKIYHYTGCSHLYHKTCIQKWIQTCENNRQTPHCPTCRNIITVVQYLSPTQRLFAQLLLPPAALTAFFYAMLPAQTPYHPRTQMLDSHYAAHVLLLSIETGRLLTAELPFIDFHNLTEPLPQAYELRPLWDISKRVLFYSITAVALPILWNAST